MLFLMRPNAGVANGMAEGHPSAWCVAGAALLYFQCNIGTSNCISGASLVDRTHPKTSAG